MQPMRLKLTIGENKMSNFKEINRKLQEKEKHQLNNKKTEMLQRKDARPNKKEMTPKGKGRGKNPMRDAKETGKEIETSNRNPRTIKLRKALMN